MPDATLSAPALTAVRPARPASASRAGPAGGSRPRKRPGARRLPARFSLIVGSAGFCAIMIGIVVNATMFQKGHHPAPLFASAAPVHPVGAAPAPAPAVLALPAGLPDLPAPAPEKQPLPAPTVIAKAPAAPVATPARHAAARHLDGIARLLGTLPERDPARRVARAVLPRRTNRPATAEPAKPAPMVN